jgi:hypothetical protein
VLPYEHCSLIDPNSVVPFGNNATYSKLHHNNSFIVGNTIQATSRTQDLGSKNEENPKT